MTAKVMNQTLGDLLKWEQNPAYSRETIRIPSGAGPLQLGTVLGRKRIGGAVTVGAAVSDAGNTGNGAVTLAAPAYGAGVKPGTYRAVCIEPAAGAGKFSVEDPSGVTIGVATVAVAFDGEIKFTIADGATDFVAGDSFSLPVAIAAPTGDCVPWDPTGADGSEIVAGVLLFDIDATEATVDTVMVARGAALSEAALLFDEAVTAAQKADAKAALGALGLPVRTAA